MLDFRFSSTAVAVLAGAALALALNGSDSLAQTASAAAPDVAVRIGPALLAKSRKLGEADVKEIAKSLADTVRGDLQGGRRAHSPIRADLVLEDAVPDRPTLQQLSDHPGLSESSIALGGATITGVVTFADGHSEPLSYSFFQDSLREERGVGQWTDADRAFELLGDDLAHGRIPHDRLDTRVADSDVDQWRP
jgi:hypothetical protein